MSEVNKASEAAAKPYVLDASAIIAFLRDEPGAAVVRDVIGKQTLVSAVNLSEVLSKLLDKGVTAEMAQHAVTTLNLDVADLDARAAYETAWLRSATRHLGLSLGDRACLALAAARNAIVLTADRPWLELASTLGVDIRSIRPDAH